MWTKSERQALEDLRRSAVDGIERAGANPYEHWMLAERVRRWWRNQVVIIDYALEHGEYPRRSQVTLEQDFTEAEYAANTDHRPS